MRPMQDNPCFGCKPPKRHGECRLTCPDWIIAKAIHEALRKEEAEQQKIDRYAIDNARKNRDHSAKRKQRFNGHIWRKCY
jgi:hypothetical protein